MTPPLATTTHQPAGGHDGYRHEALFYAGADEFMAGTVPFLRAAVEQEEPTLVVLCTPKVRALKDALNGHADRVLFADMAEVGTNPARIIPAWQDFVTDNAAPGRRLRGIGEPIWADRSAAELAECQRHEALLNVCFSDPDFWLLCPYDTETLSEAVLDEARRNHPFVSSLTEHERSAVFPGTAALARPFDEPLPEPPAGARAMAIDGPQLAQLRAFVAGCASGAGLSPDQTAELVFVVHELATNAVLHGGGEGALRVWQEPDALVCEVRDGGQIADPLAGRVRPAQLAQSGRGLWLANQLCELVQIRSLPAGSVVRVHKRLA